MTRTDITDINGVPAHLRTAAGAALAARLRVSLWQVRDLTVLHVNDGGPDGWRIWMPIERDSDALEVYTRIGVIGACTVTTSCDRVTVSANGWTVTQYAKDYRNDMGAALRGAITNAALRLYKHEQTHNLI